jgi:hypothetical protein
VAEAAGAVVAASAEAGAEGVEAAVVAEAAGAEAGTVTAAIAVAAETAAGSSRKQYRVARKPGSLEAPRFCFAKHPS